MRIDNILQRLESTRTRSLRLLDDVKKLPRNADTDQLYYAVMDIELAADRAIYAAKRHRQRRA